MRRDGIGKLILNGLVIGFMAIGVVAVTSVTGYSQGRYDNNNGRNWDGYPNWGGSFDLRQTALNAGFNEGTSAGQKDRSRGRRANYNDFNVYRSADKDYSSRLGDRNLYERYFRIAFEHGYEAQFGNVVDNGRNNGNWNNNNDRNNGNWNNDRNNNDRNTGWNNNGNWDRNNRRGRDWDRYDNFGGSAQQRQTALNAGYNEGIKQGRNDRRRGPRNLNDFSQYRNANKDYNSRLGDIGTYQRYYRQGFENGYYDGLNGY